MIQFNLLPEIKQHYIKANRVKHLVLLGSAVVGGIALSILAILFLVVGVLQKQHLDDLSKDIKTYSTQLQKTSDLNKILTIQNQLKSLPDLHSKKVVASRLFNYLSQLTPIQATIATINIDFATNTITLGGSADSLGTVNKFVDTLKFTTYKVKDTNTTPPAFSKVVLTSFGRTDTSASYQISTFFDPVIFDGASDVTLAVPHIISTRSETEKPTELFKPTDNPNTTNKVP